MEHRKKIWIESSEKRTQMMTGFRIGTSDAIFKQSTLIWKQSTSIRGLSTTISGLVTEIVVNCSYSIACHHLAAFFGTLSKISFGEGRVRYFFKFQSNLEFF